MKVKFLDNLKTLDKKLGLQRTPTWDIYLFIFPSLFTKPIVTSRNLVLGGNSDRRVHYFTLS